MSGEDRFRDLAPLFALGALDGEDLAAFEAHLVGCAACRAEVSTFTEVAGRIGASVPRVPPPAALRQRVLAAASAASAPSAGRAPRRTVWWPAGLAAAAALVLGLALLVTRTQLQRARERTAELERQVQQVELEVSQLKLQLVQAQAVRDLIARPGSRLTLLAGLQPAPQARARVVWDAASREALLFASGLQAPPAGQAYEVWVIGASNRPVPAGVFQPAPDGSAVFRLPRLEDTAQPRTFAVTIEPAAGSPSPTGPMVLAGAVS
jgi:anti-sigma-K factor RskA